eukprot:TRINITY_DN70401_c0_g1_i1.p1 TRINITY_DN70401_c0_g1~~TRINITY_DN70401_c0_g1_i1.p1  ORF type:complete len:372 (+),score=49.46 TRINITY_DN70401_c0_g1_i1:75-1190(+)
MSLLSGRMLRTQLLNTLRANSTKRFCSSGPVVPPSVNLPTTTQTFASSAAEVKIDMPTDPAEQAVRAIQALSPEEFRARFEAFDEKSKREAFTAARHDIFQMEMSMGDTEGIGKKRVKVFWKNVDAVEIEPGWWTVTLDGRKVKSLEGKDTLVLPSEPFAVAVAHEWSQQKGYLNKLTMPLTDIASSSLQLDMMAIALKLEHLMSFLGSDNLFYRNHLIADKQDPLIEPIQQWFDKEFEVTTPRFYSELGTFTFNEATRSRILGKIRGMQLNCWQIVALHSMAQFFSSIILSLGVLTGQVSMEVAQQINAMEEEQNIATARPIDGFHDLRDIDSKVKVTALQVAWNLASNLGADHATAPAELVSGKFVLPK